MKAFFQMSATERAEFCQSVGIRSVVHGKGAIAPAQTKATPVQRVKPKAPTETELSARVDRMLERGLPLSTLEQAHAGRVLLASAEQFDAYQDTSDEPGSDAGAALMAAAKRNSVYEPGGDADGELDGELMAATKRNSVSDLR